jgi:hypothetical protein
VPQRTGLQLDVLPAARNKDVIESKLQHVVCPGEMTLADARDAIVTDWIAAYKQYVHPDGCTALEPNQ